MDTEDSIYMAYGSNLDVQQMVFRCSSATGFYWICQSVFSKLREILRMIFGDRISCSTERQLYLDKIPLWVFLQSLVIHSQAKG